MKLGAIPSDAQLRGLSLRVFQILSKYTAFPWAVLQAQCQRAGIDPIALNRSDLETILADLASGVARFSSVTKGHQVRDELTALRAEETYADRAEAPADGVTCHRCDARARLGRYCSSCGESLRSEHRCPDCGAAVAGRFCSCCGTLLGT